MLCITIWNTMSNVNHPKHYKSGDLECIDAIEAQMSAEEFRGFLKGNVLKYLWREKQKGGVEKHRVWGGDKLS